MERSLRRELNVKNICMNQIQTTHDSIHRKENNYLWICTKIYVTVSEDSGGAHTQLWKRRGFSRA